MSYTINDKRGKETPPEPCRVCGGPIGLDKHGKITAHTKEYNKPTMDCIKYLRAELTTVRDQLTQKVKK